MTTTTIQIIDTTTAPKLSEIAVGGKAAFAAFPTEDQEVNGQKGFRIADPYFARDVRRTPFHALFDIPAPARTDQLIDAYASAVIDPEDALFEIIVAAGDVSPDDDIPGNSKLDGRTIGTITEAWVAAVGPDNVLPLTTSSLVFTRII